ncbi:MAG: hypothetical protein AABO58_25835 [Acidobacteriota bacterium]
MRRLVLLLLIVAPCALAQSGVWGLRGITKRFVLRGNAVVAVDGRGVAVYDATTLAKLDAAETDAESVDAAFAGDTLIVLTRDGFERFSMAAGGRLTFLSSHPETSGTRMASNGELVAVAGSGGVRVFRAEAGGLGLTGNWPQAERVTSLAWRGNALFAAVRSSGVHVLDGTTLEEIGKISENAIDIAVDGDFLYSAAGSVGMAIHDVRNVAAAQLVSRTAAGEDFFQLVAASGGRAVAAEVSKSIRVFDVSNPAAPRVSAPIAQTAEAIAVGGARLFVSGSSFDDDNVETATGIPVRAYDIAQAEAPRVAGDAHDLAGPLNGAATDGTLAYVSDPPFFRVIDVSTTAQPREIASLRLDDIEPFVKSDGTRVILYGTGTVQFIDVSNPYRPKHIGTYDSLGHPPSAAAIARNVFIEGNTSSGFHVFDFLPDGSSRFLAGIKTHPVDIVVSGDAVYYSVEHQTVGIADISEGARPVSAILTPAIQMALTGNLLLLRSLEAVHVYSIADPFNPVELSAVPLERGGVFAANGDAAWVAARGTVVRMDLANPASPSFQPTGMRVVAPAQIAAAGGKVVVADRYALRVIGPNTAPPAPQGPGKRRAARP